MKHNTQSQEEQELRFFSYLLGAGGLALVPPVTFNLGVVGSNPTGLTNEIPQAQLPPALAGRGPV